MSSPSGAAGGVAARALLRATAFLVLWLVLAGADPADLVAGAVAVVAATWASLRLLPPGSARVSPVALAHLALRFACQSVIAGTDVARRAFDPRLPLRPGFVRYPVRFPPGPVRNAFTALTSLLQRCRRGKSMDSSSTIASTSTSRWRRSWPRRKRRCRVRLVMTEFLTAVLGLILALLALGLVRVLRGPGEADRMMAAQLIGTGGIASLLLLGAVTGVPATVDVALTVALLATFASIAFVKKGSAHLEAESPESMEGG